VERYHYCFATDFAEDLRPIGLALPCLRSSEEGFMRNILRIQSLGRLPILLVGAAVVTQTFDMLATFRLRIQEDDPRIKLGHPSFNLKLYNKKESIRKTMQMAWFQRVKAGETASGMTVGEVALGTMIPAGGDETAEGIEAILMGMITGLWTSFEVLAEEIWNSAVLERPVLVAGITEKEWKASGFRSIRKLRSLYGYTFRKDETGISKVLNDNRIEALALTRNIIVHTGGVIDEQFDRRRGSIEALSCFSITQLGEKIKVTGPIVHDLLRPVAILGLELFRAVDSWLVSHP
jgi:hypothetical protein